MSNETPYSSGIETIPGGIKILAKMQEGQLKHYPDKRKRISRVIMGGLNG